MEFSCSALHRRETESLCSRFEIRRPGQDYHLLHHTRDDTTYLLLSTSRLSCDQSMSMSGLLHTPGPLLGSQGRPASRKPVAALAPTSHFSLLTSHFTSSPFALASCAFCFVSGSASFFLHCEFVNTPLAALTARVSVALDAMDHPGERLPFGEDVITSLMQPVSQTGCHSSSTTRRTLFHNATMQESSSRPLQSRCSEATQHCSCWVDGRAKQACVTCCSWAPLLVQWLA